MIQEIYQKAMKFAGEAHKNQKVPGTEANYLLHISNVAMEVILAHKEEPCFDLALAVQIAILHDSIEDTDVTEKDLTNIFNADVATGVSALTKNNALGSKKEKMADSIRRIKANPYKEVAIVKMADRITNLQQPPEHWSSEKINDYLKEGELILRELGEHNTFLSSRLESKLKEYTNWC